MVEIEGGRANASLATLGAIADALGVDFGRLIQPQQAGAGRTVRTADAAAARPGSSWSRREPQSVGLWS